MSDVSRRSKKKKNHSPLSPPLAPTQPQDQMVQMVQIMANSKFKMDDVCGKFNPTKHSALELLPAYKNFRCKLEVLEVVIKELNFTRTEM